jgi:ACT domain-containing protein
MKKTIITVIGKDRVGIIATVCTYLAEHNINILDIDQSIIQGFFHMMMIVDANGADKEFAALVKDLSDIGEQLGVQIKMQHEDIFNIMHRI